MLNYVNSCPKNQSQLAEIYRRRRQCKKIINRKHVQALDGTTDRNNQRLFADPKKRSRVPVPHICHLREGEILSDQPPRRSVGRKEREVGTRTGAGG